jgi:hypothetical protein
MVRDAVVVSVPRGKHARTATVGWSRELPSFVTAVVVAAGAAVVIVAYRMARTSTTQTHFLVFWVGFIAALLAIAIRGVSTNVGRAERAILITSFGLLTFLPKFLMSVNAAVYRDEYPHWAQVNNMVASGNLRPTNSLLPVIRDYPGLETLTYAIHEVTRLSTWHSGQIIIVIAHCASLFSVAAIARAVGATDRGALIAAVVFGLNPSLTYSQTHSG